jgi:hypothetical protein
MSIRRTDCHRDSRVGHSVSPGSLARHHHHLAMLLPVHRAQDAEKDPSHMTARLWSTSMDTGVNGPPSLFPGSMLSLS